MPLQNRVAPDGSLHGVAARGLFMGNRGGRIHDPNTRSLMRRRWASKAWICCVTSFRDRHRNVWGRSYTELFFLDEVTALAAGHRPCFECRRGDAIRFAEAWADSQGRPGRARAAAMDSGLHGERTALTHQMLTFSQAVALPAGAIELPGGAVLKLLTPASIVNVLRIGYRPVWHESALGAG
jgi:hypothetical protein